MTHWTPDHLKAYSQSQLVLSDSQTRSSLNVPQFTKPAWNGFCTISRGVSESRSVDIWAWTGRSRLSGPAVGSCTGSRRLRSCVLLAPLPRFPSGRPHLECFPGSSGRGLGAVAPGDLWDVPTGRSAARRQPHTVHRGAKPPLLPCRALRIPCAPSCSCLVPRSHLSSEIALGTSYCACPTTSYSSSPCGSTRWSLRLKPCRPPPLRRLRLPPGAAHGQTQTKP